MRLSSKQQATVRTAIREAFGPDTAIWLFGSRARDDRRGGDYDFYLEVGTADAAEIVQRKLELLSRLHATPEFEDEKIDIVIRPRNAGIELPIYRVARSEGVRL